MVPLPRAVPRGSGLKAHYVTASLQRADLNDREGSRQSTRTIVVIVFALLNAGVLSPARSEGADRVSFDPASFASSDTTESASPDTSILASPDTSVLASPDTTDIAASDSTSVDGLPAAEPHPLTGPLAPNPVGPGIALRPGVNLANGLRGPDTMRLRFELGASSDFTNEQFYEDAFIDTVALGRRLVGDPESQVAAVFGTIFDGTRSRRASGIHLQNELSLGAKLQRDEFRAEWRSLGLEGLQWMVSPWGEYRRDRTFGRDLEEARASGLGRLQYRFPDRSGLAEVSGTVEALRTRGVGADFVPDRNVARMQTHFEHTPLLGTNWSLGYGAVARQFPDSTYRNHLEHQVGAAIHQDMLGGHSVELTSDFLRRSTFEPAPTTEDNFWELDLAGEVIALLGDVTSLIVRPSTESIRYDEPDSTIYFDYDILRALVAPQWTGGSWTARVGPRGELLRSPHDRTEEYREIAGVVELEWTARGGWWSASPAVGWRDYDDEPLLPSIAPSGALLTPSGRSSYAFYELIAIGDQALPGAMRLHLYASGRYERHIDSAQNARSLYFSFDVRRLF